MEYEDQITSLTQVRLSWVDRFKVLCTGRLCVKSVTRTEFEVGAAKAEVKVWTPGWRKPKLVVYGEGEAREADVEPETRPATEAETAAIQKRFDAALSASMPPSGTVSPTEPEATSPRARGSTDHD